MKQNTNPSILFGFVYFILQLEINISTRDYRQYSCILSMLQVHFAVVFIYLNSCDYMIITQGKWGLLASLTLGIYMLKFIYRT